MMDRVPYNEELEIVIEENWKRFLSKFCGEE